MDLLAIATTASRRDAGRVQRLQRVLSAAGADIMTCGWQDVVVESDGVSVFGRELRKLLFFPRRGSGDAGDDPREQAAVARLQNLGWRGTSRNRNILAAAVLREAGRRSVVTNALGPEGQLGHKDRLEFILRASGRATARRIPRPRTVVASASQLRQAVAYFQRRGEACVIKPANRSRGEGIRIVAASAEFQGAPGDGEFVVQALVANPVLADERKVDLRAYLRIDSHCRSRSGLLGPMFVRRAAAAYDRGQLEAEITNSAFKAARGAPIDIRPLSGHPELDIDRIRAQTRAVAAALTDTATARIQSHPVAPGDGRRVLLWGIDLLPHWVGGRQELSLLEVNCYPQLFRGVPDCDRACEAMLVEEYLPMLSQGGSA